MPVLKLPDRWMTPRRLMTVSIGVALLTITLKVAAWKITGSVGLLSDALESVVNLAAAVFGLTMITVAEMPPDAGHPFGHEKAEYFSAGFEGILIMVAALAIIWTAVPRLSHPEPLMQVGWGMALAILSSMFNGVLAWIMLQASRRHHSIALEADAKHLFTDVWTSAGVIAGVLLVAISGLLWLDAVVAILVALNIVREGYHLIRRSAQGLMDAAIEPDMQAAIRNTLQAFSQHQPDGQATVYFDHMLTRKAGQRRFLNLHMHMPPSWTLAQAADLRQQVEAALLELVPGLYPSIEMLPDGVEPMEVLDPQPEETPVAERSAELTGAPGCTP